MIWTTEIRKNVALGQFFGVGLSYWEALHVFQYGMKIITVKVQPFQLSVVTRNRDITKRVTVYK